MKFDPLTCSGPEDSVRPAGGPPHAVTPQDIPARESQSQRSPTDPELMTRLGMAYCEAKNYGFSPGALHHRTHHGLRLGLLSHRGRDNSTLTTSNNENVFTLGLSGGWPIARKISLEPLAEARFWSPDQGSGQL